MLHKHTHTYSVISGIAAVAGELVCGMELSLGALAPLELELYQTYRHTKPETRWERERDSVSQKRQQTITSSISLDPFGEDAQRKREKRIHSSSEAYSVTTEWLKLSFQWTTWKKKNLSGPVLWDDITRVRIHAVIMPFPLPSPCFS